MAINLKVQTTQTSLKVSGSDGAKLTVDQGIPIYPTDYTGTYKVAPTNRTQTLPTKGLMMSKDVVVDPIPSNYGLITWNGSTLTVS